MEGTTISFLADQKLASRVKEMARADGVTQSQAAAHAAAFGGLLSSASRRNLRVILEEGGAEAQKDLAVALAKAIARVGNAVLERRLLARSTEPSNAACDESDEDLARRSVEAVKANRWGSGALGPSGGF